MEDLKTANQDLLSQLTAVKEELTMKDYEKKYQQKQKCKNQFYTSNSFLLKNSFVNQFCVLDLVSREL